MGLLAVVVWLTRCDQPAARASKSKRAKNDRHRCSWWSGGLLAPAAAGPHDDRASRAVAKLTAIAETIAGLATVRTALVVAGALAALGVGWVVLRSLATRRALRPNRRVRLMALPTETFDPTGEEVDRYAAQLSRVRRTVRGGLDRRAHAVRLRLDSVAGGGCVYRIEGSAQAASILRLTGYAEVDLRPADALDTAAPGCLVAVPDGRDGDEPADQAHRARAGSLEEQEARP